jgi:hypothetical protein
MHRTHVRRIGLPSQIAVRTGPDGAPADVSGRPVASVRDEWRVDEGWWSGHRLRRDYFDVVLDDGRDVVVFRDLKDGRWYGQRA